MIGYYYFIKNTSILNIEIISLLGGNFFRVLIISVKYGSFPEEKIRLYKNQIINRKDFLNDLTIPSVLFPNYQVIYTEIMSALLRSDIDISFFWLHFYVSPHKKILKRLKSYEKNLIEYHHRKWLDYIPLITNEQFENKENKNIIPFEKTSNILPIDFTKKLNDNEKKENTLKIEKFEDFSCSSKSFCILNKKEEVLNEKLEINKKKKKSFRKKFKSLFERKIKKKNPLNKETINEEITQHYGVFIVFELIQNFLKKRKIVKAIIMVIIVMIPKTVLTYYLRKKEKKTLFGNSVGEVITIIILTLNNLGIIMNISCVCFSLIFSLKLKTYLMKQCSYLISPKRTLEYKEIKLLPTINIYNSFNIKAWNYIRKVCLDYGRQFSYRMEVFISLLILYVIIINVFLTLEIFDKIEIESSIKIIFIFDSIFVMIILTVALLCGAYINDHFRLN